MKKRTQAGFTLIEFLGVAALLVVVIGITYAALNRGGLASLGKTQADYELECVTSLKRVVGMNPDYTSITSARMAEGNLCPEKMENASNNGLVSVWGGTVTVAVLDATNHPDKVSFTTTEVNVDSCQTIGAQLGNTALGLAIDPAGSGSYTWVKDYHGFGGTVINELQEIALIGACNDTNSDNVVTIRTYYR